LEGLALREKIRNLNYGKNKELGQKRSVFPE
jgi:hypothetical protein